MAAGAQDNEVRGDGVAALVPALQHLSSLQTLNLHNNRLAPEACEVRPSHPPLLAPLLSALLARAVPLGPRDARRASKKHKDDCTAACTFLRAVELGGEAVGFAVQALVRGVAELHNLKLILLTLNMFPSLEMDVEHRLNKVPLPSCLPFLSTFLTCCGYCADMACTAVCLRPLCDAGY
eukprot:1040901-Rhodomonas_salina.2